MQFEVIMAGRKRRSGARERNGRPQRKSVLAEKDLQIATAAGQPHRRGIPLQIITDPKAATALGRLHLRKVINQAQYDAGDKYSAIAERYRAVIDGPADLIGHSLERKNGGKPWFSQEEAEQRTTAHRNAFSYLEKTAGQRCACAVARVAIQDRPVEGDEVIYLRRGLTALAEHFGLTNQRKRHLSEIDARSVRPA